MRLLFEDAAFDLEDVPEGLEELQLLVFSVTDVPAEDQLLLADGVGEGSALDAPFVCACAEHSGGGCLFAGRVAERMDDGASDPAIASPYAEAAVELPPHVRLPLPGGAGGPGGGAGQLAGRIEAAAQAVWRYGDPGLQAQVYATVPVATLVERAAAAAATTTAVATEAAAAPPPLQLPFRDRLLGALVGWFKADFFSWMGEFPPACAGCGRGDQLDHAGVSGPASPDEVAGEAGRVELFRCRACAAPTRVPRYNNPARLLTWRRGRCGEWANAFTAVAIALGFDARHVTDWSDHVWTEVWSPGRRRYVHVDSCEAAVDAPLLYERGWGKKGLSFIVAAGPDAVVDVTRRYTRRYADDLLPRRAGVVDEAWLAGALRIIDGRQRLRRRGGAVGPGVVNDDGATAPPPPQPPYRISPSRLAVLSARLAEERAELDATLTEGQAAGSGGAAASEALPGRITGSVEWRAARGELGNGAPAAATTPAEAAAAAPAAQAGTVTVRPAPVRVGPAPDEGGRYLRGAAAPTPAQRAAAAAHDTRPTFPPTRMGPAPATTVLDDAASRLEATNNTTGGAGGIDSDSPAERAWPSLRRGPSPRSASSTTAVAEAVTAVGGAPTAPAVAALAAGSQTPPPTAVPAQPAPAPAPVPSPADVEAARLAAQAALRARVQRLFRQLTAVPPGAAAQQPCAHPHCAGNPALGPQPPSAAAASALKLALAAAASGGGSDDACFCGLHSAP
jgi:peptide-N4-(N-acetyl-beta-glucosaminyl)asparagine amidase